MRCDKRPRLLPDTMLPPYTHVPGRTPHPFSDPLGHSFQKRAETVTEPDPMHPADCRALLWGIDLFNNGYYWEAHETWEGIWQAAGRKGLVAAFFKGLIQLAVAGVKQYERKDEGMRRHAVRAVELFREVAQPLWFGLCIADLISIGHNAASHGWPDPPPILVFCDSPGTNGLVGPHRQRQE